MDDIRTMASNIIVGMQGEQHCRNYLAQKKHSFFQADLISMDKATGKYYLWEVKHKERFRAPPFDGHGLSPWQVRHRLDFYEKTGIRPILYVLDKETGDVFVQALDVLASGDNFTTKTGKMVVFPIENFEVIQYGSGCQLVEDWQNAEF